MTITINSIPEVSERAKNALLKELGVADTLRFLSQFRADNGNYTEEREQLFAGETVSEIVASIKAQRKRRA